VTRLDSGPLEPGVYFARIDQAGSAATHRFVVLR
jgi:hypothetical protein